MPTYSITDPTGKVYSIDGPPGATQEQVIAQIQAHQQVAAPAAGTDQAPTFTQKINSLVSGARQAPYDILQSGIELGARGLDATGLTQDALPNTKKFFDQSNKDAAEISGADPNGGFYKGGRIAGQVVSTLPAAALKVPGLAANLPRLAPIVNGALGGAASAAATSNSSDAPLRQQVELGAAGGAALPALGLVKNGATALLPHLLGGSTGAGAEAVRGAYQAGKAGGAAGTAFTDSMRGATPWESVVADAKDALANMRAQRNAQYRSGMQDISKDATVLDFKPVDDALAQANNVKTYKGQDLSSSTAAVRQEITDAINNWKGLDPAEYHTPEGFDALKQQLGDIRDALPFNTPQRVVADQVYNSVRKTIADQAPTYSKVMQDYSTASDQISNIQRELSLGSKGNPGTALRKLQSVMRNNANTSWGARADMAGKLSDAGAPTLLPQLAGQSMNAVLPRGLARVVDGGLAGAGAMLHPGALAALPLASPRLVGEAAYGLGAVNRGATGLARKVPLQLPSLQFSPAAGLLAPALAYQN
jgi:hypothetical protein